MIYYYAYSGHKYGLDRVKRAVALIKSLAAQGVEVSLLLNDFRAGLAAREMGVMDSVTVETILDIDAVAKRGDIVFIDSPEDDRGKLGHYVNEYKLLFRVTDDCRENTSYGEILMKPVCGDDEDCFSSLLIDPNYFERVPREKRRLFFLGDADYDKAILSNAVFFEDMDMELLLGHYFFVQYEDDLAKLFDILHEPEEYSDLLCSSNVITASIQCALDAKAANADVIYLKKPEDSACLLREFEIFGIKIIDGFNKEQLIEAIASSDNGRKVPNFINNTIEKIIRKFDL